MPNQFQNAAFPLSHQMKETSKPVVIKSKSLKKWDWAYMGTRLFIIDSSIDSTNLDLM